MLYPAERAIDGLSVSAGARSLPDAKRTHHQKAKKGRKVKFLLGAICLLGFSLGPVDDGDFCESRVTEIDGFWTLHCDAPCASSCQTVAVTVGNPQNPIDAWTCACSDDGTPDRCCQIVLIDGGGTTVGGNCGGPACDPGNACNANVETLLVAPWTVTYGKAYCSGP